MYGSLSLSLISMTLCSGTILHCRLTKRDVERPKGVTPYHQTVLEVETVPIFSLTMFLEEMLS